MTRSWTWYRANQSRVLRWGTILGGFALVQLSVQSLNAVAGFLMVRSLDKPNYAWFTIISGMSAALSVLADSGIGSAVTSIGGGIWQDKNALSNLITAALRLRLKMAVLATLLVAPLSIWMLLLNGAPLTLALLLSTIVLVPVWNLSTAAVLNVVNRLHSRTWQLQIADLVPATVRALLTLVLVSSGLISPLTAMLAILISQAVQYAIVRNQVRPFISEKPDPDSISQYSKRVLQVIKHLYPNSLFICFQAQLAAWLISVFATTYEVADFGALNRLAIIYTLLAAPVLHSIAPAFARARTNQELNAIASITVVCYLTAIFILTLASYYFGDLILAILGAKYLNLQSVLPLAIATAGLSSLVQGIWELNVARGWTGLSKLIPVITVTVMFLAGWMIQPKALQSVLLFQFIILIPSCCLGFIQLLRGCQLATFQSQ